MRTGSFRKGSMLGKYRLERLMGCGSFASVWRARDTVENRVVALKIVAVPSTKGTTRGAAISASVRTWANCSAVLMVRSLGRGPIRGLS